MHTLIVKLLLGVFGAIAVLLNCVLIAVFSKNSSLRRGFNIFVYHLCIANLLVGINDLFQVVIYDLYAFDNGKGNYRTLFKVGLAALVASYLSSLLNVVGLTVSRLLVIMYPLQIDTYMRDTRFRKILTANWLIALTIMIITLVLGLHTRYLPAFYGYVITISLTSSFIVMSTSHAIMFKQVILQIKNIKETKSSFEFSFKQSSIGQLTATVPVGHSFSVNEYATEPGLNHNGGYEESNTNKTVLEDKIGEQYQQEGSVTVSKHSSHERLQKQYERFKDTVLSNTSVVNDKECLSEGIKREVNVDQPGGIFTNIEPSNSSDLQEDSSHFVKVGPKTVVCKRIPDSNLAVTSDIEKSNLENRLVGTSDSGCKDQTNSGMRNENSECYNIVTGNNKESQFEKSIKSLDNSYRRSAQSVLLDQREKKAEQQPREHVSSRLNGAFLCKKHESKTDHESVLNRLSTINQESNFVLEEKQKHASIDRTRSSKSKEHKPSKKRYLLSRARNLKAELHAVFYCLGISLSFLLTWFLASLGAFGLLINNKNLASAILSDAADIAIACGCVLSTIIHVSSNRDLRRYLKKDVNRTLSCIGFRSSL
ncbi:uncharacterized protein LOC135685108 [Rhopilema esculentum]|uniref:uncharacterized protein LOC135685108 n=1 Tax=Rhopilema esculentum TaxID=499914 RepID=UPI0031D76A6E